MWITQVEGKLVSIFREDAEDSGDSRIIQVKGKDREALAESIKSLLNVNQIA